MLLQQRIVYFFLSLFICIAHVSAKSAVTYTFSGGRLGDNLLAYCHAKWIAYKYDIPLLYRAFPYSDQLMMHEKEILLTQEEYAKYDAIIDISKVYPYLFEPEKNILYVIPYFPESIIEREKNPRFFYYFPVDWDDYAFKAELCTMISPRFPLTITKKPKDCLTIALHVRIGTGFDIASLKDYPNQTAENISQLKFPPLTYYIQQLKRIAEYYPNELLHVRMFTDHNNPAELADFFKENVQCPRMGFAYRNDDNRHDLNVLEDFFSITQFDCLIRPDANFSTVASKLGHYKIQISPWHCIVHENQYHIDEILMNNVILKN